MFCRVWAHPMWWSIPRRFGGSVADAEHDSRRIKSRVSRSKRRRRADRCWTSRAVPGVGQESTSWITVSAPSAFLPIASGCWKVAEGGGGHDVDTMVSQIHVTRPYALGGCFGNGSARWTTGGVTAGVILWNRRFGIQRRQVNVSGKVGSL